MQQALGQVLVARDAFRDRAGMLGFGGPDAARARTVAKLHQVALVQAQRGNTALGGGIDDIGGAGAERDGIGQFMQCANCGGNVERTIFDRRHHHVARGGERDASDRFVACTHRDLVHAAPAGLARLAETGLHAGQVLQLDHHVLHDVRGPGAFAQPQQEAAALADAAAMLDQARQPGAQAFIKTGNGIGRRIFEIADIDPGFDDRPVGPDVRSAQRQHIDNLDGFLVHLTSRAEVRTGCRTLSICSQRLTF